jgi:hypothetical protein
MVITHPIHLILGSRVYAPESALSPSQATTAIEAMTIYHTRLLPQQGLADTGGVGSRA